MIKKMYALRLGIAAIAFALCFAVAYPAFALESVFATTTIDTLWNTAGADIWGFVSPVFWLAASVTIVLALLGLAWFYIQRARKAVGSRR